MTRHKRRKIAGIIRVCILLVFPVVVAFSVKGIPVIKNFFDKMGSISIENHNEMTVTETTTQPLLLMAKHL